MQQTTFRTVSRIALATLLAMPLQLVLAMVITSTQDIAFGTIVSGPAGGTVTVPAIGSGAQCSSGLTCLSQSSASPARFQITEGSPNTSFNVGLPFSIVLSAPTGETITVDSFTDSLGGAGQFNSFGNASFNVGATLHLAPGQRPASYSGSFDVTINYQ